GLLIYVKPTVYGRKEPRDVLEYREGNPTFPHQSTADQFFDEPQFESHRMLGFHIFEGMLRDDAVTSPHVPAPPPAGVGELFRRLRAKAERRAQAARQACD
ncbi:MAG TPA: hypothetical protein VF508_10795, partial [Pyrinomonadaceae bacterium]